MLTHTSVAGMHHGITSQPGMMPPMSTAPLGSTVPNGAFSPYSPQSMWAGGVSREREQEEEVHEERGGQGGAFSCCLSSNSMPNPPPRPEIFKAEKRKEKAEKRHEEREKKLREKHEEKVREKHMERMRERH